MSEPLQSLHMVRHERDAASFIVFTNILPFSVLPSGSPVAPDRPCPEIRIPLTEKKLFQALAVNGPFSAIRRLVRPVSRKTAYCIFFSCDNKMQPFSGPELTSITLNFYRSLTR